MEAFIRHVERLFLTPGYAGVIVGRGVDVRFDEPAKDMNSMRAKVRALAQDSYVCIAIDVTGPASAFADGRLVDWYESMPPIDGLVRVFYLTAHVADMDGIEFQTSFRPSFADNDFRFVLTWKGMFPRERDRLVERLDIDHAEFEQLFRVMRARYQRHDASWSWEPDEAELPGFGRLVEDGVTREDVDTAYAIQKVEDQGGTRLDALPDDVRHKIFGMASRAYWLCRDDSRPIESCSKAGEDWLEMAADYLEPVDV